MRMRENLFRGKPKDKEHFNAFSIAWASCCFNGFVYGSLVVHNNRYFIVVTAQCSNKSIINNGITTMIEVIPQTVGQYTGLTDKNGIKIFESDIVKTQPFYDKPYSDKRKSKHFIGVVEYKVKTFGGNWVYSKQDYHAEWGLKFYEDFDKYSHYSWGELWNCEIIGNIHDNPELLKGGDDNG